MEKRNGVMIVVAALLVTAGLTGAGYMVGRGVADFSLKNRFVTAKGLAEKEVKADLAVWKVTIKAAAETREEAHAIFEKRRDAVLALLKRQDIQPSEMTLEDTRFEDMLEREYGGSEKLLRFHMRQRIIVRSSDVDKVSAVSKESASEGAENINDSSMSYHFTRLDQLRPLMLSQSMESARTVAHRMAQDCKVSLGDVRSIHQGVFTIVGRDHHDDGQGYDNGESLYKKVRIVSTISYFLK